MKKMKKVTSGGRISAMKERGIRMKARGIPMKARGIPRSIDEYLSSVPEPARSTLNKMRSAIRSAVPPEAAEVISYRMPAVRHKGVLVWFAAFSDHCSLFPTPAVIKAFKNDLKGFATSKGTIQFPA